MKLSYDGYRKLISALQSLLGDEFDRVYGIHSNIPECCVNAWMGYEHGEICKEKLVSQDLTYEMPVYYRLCTDCYNKKHYHILHECTEECTPEAVIADYKKRIGTL